IWMAWSLIMIGGLGCGGESMPGPASTPGRLPAPPTRKATSAPGVSPSKSFAVTPSRLRVIPASSTLSPGDTGLQLLARSVGTRGGEVDLTSKVAWRVEPAGVAVVDAQGALRPQGPGVATVWATLGDEEASSRVTVLAEPERGWDFAQDVVPILSRLGCNSGACHGKGDGQNGFRLSLFGYDPAGDHQSVTRESGAAALSARSGEEPAAPQGDGPSPPRWRPATGVDLCGLSDPGRMDYGRCARTAGEDARRPRGAGRRARQHPAR
ncbi:MAG: hypothetical protein WKF75_19120, partial [Singulisphaera sp.]